jgi:Rad3-related DNA helicase
MRFDLDRRRIELSVGDFSDFSLGPRSGGQGMGGLWRAQQGSRWHRELREQAVVEGVDAEFEVPVDGVLAHRGWSVVLAGRIDQVVRSGAGAFLREIKTVTRPLPESEETLRADYPGYFVQLAAYAALRGQGEGGELLFIEADSGLAQTVPLRSDDVRLLDAQLGRIAEFLDLKQRCRERLRSLRYRPAFAVFRPGQEDVEGRLRDALRSARSAVLLEAPTGFGKTGVLLGCALGELREGTFERLVYVTGKSTGQLQVLETLRSMTAPGPGLEGGTAVAAWLVRNKAEHCVNDVFQCVREACSYLDGAETRWQGSGLSRFYLLENQARDIASLRSAGKAARICPYEITRAALPFNDVWIGDYNYVFSPESRGLFYERPGFDPARTLLAVDEAHNLASRVADAHSHVFSMGDARAVAEALRDADAPRSHVALWDEWAFLLGSLTKAPSLPESWVDDARDIASRISEALTATPIDYAALGPHASGLLWRVASFTEQLNTVELPRLWWSPSDGLLNVTCLDAATAIGSTLAEFGGVVMATATPGPTERFAEAVGTGPLEHLTARTPWRDGAYDVAVDLRVDTSFQQRHSHVDTTASTVAALHASAGDGAPIAVFFPSFAYAESIADRVASAAMQPRRADLAAQNAWIADSLDAGRALFLVLGSGFAEGIDLLGGRVAHAMVVGPALPEVNPVQRAKLASFAALGRDLAFDRVYRIPGMVKVNQALGRLVRAPSQKARVLLHCRRFAEPGYERLLCAEYQDGRRIREDGDFTAWLSGT